MKTTFVTAFIDLQESRSNEAFLESCFQHFLNLASTGISMYCFLSSKLYTQFASRLPTEYPIIYSILELDETFAHRDLEGLSYSLPANRSPEKDTANYMKLMNAKIDFVKRAMEVNPFQTSQFAWIDFRICHVLTKNWTASLASLQTIATKSLNRQKVVFPGCWSKGTQSDQLTTTINWRFCGGFFMGTRDALESMYALTRNTYRKQIEATRVLVWEVNVWHQMELQHGFEVDWYSGDHNERILQIPSEWFSAS